MSDARQRERLTRRPGCHMAIDDCYGIPWTGTSTVRAFPETPCDRGELPNVLTVVGRVQSCVLCEA